MATNKTNLDGYRVNERGHLVPEGMIEELDKTRDELVIDLAERWMEHHYLLRELKSYAMSEIMNFCDLAAMEYDTHLGGNKGNVQIMSFDGKVKVKIQVHQTIVFDERLLVAKQLVDECRAIASKKSTITAS